MVITIIGILIALLLPAVQAAREAARRTQCNNNLKQLALSSLNLEQTQRHIPTGGWGFLYTGDPNLGTGRNQPGGWLFNLLPFLEQRPLHDLGLGLSAARLKTALAQMDATPLTMAICPSRRGVKAYPYALNKLWTSPQNADPETITARSDYVANGGDGPHASDAGMPSGSPPGPTIDPSSAEALETGVMYQRSMVKAADITDGLSNTYLIGEKSINADHYLDGVDDGDDQGMYAGYSLDGTRWTQNSPESNPPYCFVPIQDVPGMEFIYQFGSVHAVSCGFAFCDGSVRSINYSIDPETNRRLGNRMDGLTIDAKKL